MMDMQKSEMPIRVAILTASDRGAQGLRDDVSGKVIAEMVQEQGWEVVYYDIVPDNRALLGSELQKLSDVIRASLILTTGGTGIAPSDFTPDATLDVIHKEVPGLAEAMRKESMKKTPHAMLSRAVCGIRGRSLIINLPGSPRAVRECLEIVIPAIPHAADLLRGTVTDCGLP